MSKRLKNRLHEAYRREIAPRDGMLVVGLVPMKVEEMNRLRRELEKERLRLRVVRNRVARKALGEGVHGKVGALLRGPSAVILGEGPEAPIRASKVLAAWGKKHKAVPVRGGLLEGVFLDVAIVGGLTKVPDRKVVLARVVGQMAAPLSGFVTVAAGVAAGLVRALHGVAEQRRKAEEAPAAG